MAASHCSFSYDKMVECQSSVLEGESGNGGRELRMDGGGGARLWADGQLTEAAPWMYQSMYEAGL